MKKKVWGITVKDNPNRVVMGENDEFYTTDTEAFLVFKLDDKNFNPATAVLTLENRNDGSLKNEAVDVVDGLIEWEMPQRYIEHFGNWQGQLVYEDTKDGQPELYTSAAFTFVVNAHIGDKKKPSLVEIENWEKFIREGTELIETWEDLEALREENERQRELAESARQTTFETNESTRQSEFETNEAERENTFEVSESARQTNELARETAESERVSNEEERISKDSERDSKIEALGEQVEVPITNTTPNGDFRDGTDGWISSRGTLEIQESGLVFTITEPAWNTLIRLDSRVNVPIGKHYWRVVANTPKGRVDLRLGDVANEQRREPGVFDVYSNVVKVDSNVSTFNQIYLSTGEEPVNTQIIVKNILTINLTDTFGAGNEPTAEQMDKLLEQFPNSWFDGTVNIYNSKHMMNLYHEEISKKVNRQQENWIVPTLLNGHTQGDYWANFAYFKDSLGFVYYEGIIDSTNSTHNIAFDFPVGYRPLRGRVHSTNNVNVASEIAVGGSFVIPSKTRVVFSGKFYAGVE